ncbi:hypothetical protein [Zavarzinella formosa]|uniref:hypothetical protein n=1 Tax=Zavarzinella formosa TaxID=360055 RepID=UPI0003074D38|nr:hypothetical protein [Zavarzinella formosa]
MSTYRFIPAAPAVRSTRTASLRIDTLEARLTPVVGALTNAPLVSIGSGYDGVALLQPTDADGGADLASGTLLDSGLYVLSAGHVLKDADGGIPSAFTNVTFQLNDGTTDRDITIKVPKNLYKVDSAFTGDVTAGNDISLLPLPDQVTPGANRFMIAPFGAERHSLYTGKDEIGKTFTVVGYGRAGNGYSGGVVNTSGTKRSGRNTFDADASKLATAPFNSPAPPAGTALAWDFDDGTAAHDAFGTLFGIHNTGLGSSEANPAQGDSGGPLFIGDKIAGVVSYSDGGVSPPDINNVIDRGFGEFGVATRASAFQDFVNQNTAGKKHLVLDLNYQLVGLDQKTENLTITVSRVGSGDVSIGIAGASNPDLNGEYYRGHLSDISDITIRGAGDNERFLVDPNVDVPVIASGGGGNNSIGSLDKSGSWVVNGTNAGSFDNGQIRFTQVQNVLGSNGQDVYKFTPNGRLTGKIDGESLSPTRTTGGYDFIDYSGTPGPVTVNLQTHTATRVGGGIFDVPNVIGSSTGGDRLTGDNAGSILITHGSGNILRAGTGDSILVGGLGSNTLIGGTGDDLLISGSITQEKNIDSLDSLFATWQDDKKPEQTLSSQLTLNKTVTLGKPSQTGPRLGRGALGASALTGNGGQDWFWTPAASLIKDRRADELMNGQTVAKTG